jgi:Fe-S cluster assembly protein SufD
MSIVAELKPTSTFSFKPNKHSVSDFALPTTRVESWKYTRVGAIDSTWKQAERNESIVALEKGIRIENGFIALPTGQIQGVSVTAGKNLSSEQQALILSILAKENRSDVFDAISETASNDLVLVEIQSGKIIEDVISIEIENTLNDCMSAPYVFIVSKENSIAKFTIDFKGKTERSFHLVQLHAHVEQSAQLEIHQLQNTSKSECVLLRESVSQAEKSIFKITTVTASGTWVRNELSIRIEGQYCESFLSGAYFPKQDQMIDNHTFVDHQVANCYSNELYKGVLFDNGKGVFNGKVYVHIDAQKTNAYQSNANIMMSDNASMFTKPELEIYADDVKCSHGSTTGQFNEEALFYLRARGLSEESAKRLLVSAFTSDVMNRISIPSWKEYVLATLIQNEIITE